MPVRTPGIGLIELELLCGPSKRKSFPLDGLPIAVLSSTHLRRLNMLHLIPLAAAGYSLIYLLLGGGIPGAILIFIVAKMLGK